MLIDQSSIFFVNKKKENKSKKFSKRKCYFGLETVHNYLKIIKTNYDQVLNYEFNLY